MSRWFGALAAMVLVGPFVWLSSPAVHTQTQLSALPREVRAPADDPASLQKSSSVGCSSGIRFFPGTKTSRAPAVIIRSSDMRRISTSRSASTGSASAPGGDSIDAERARSSSETARRC